MEYTKGEWKVDWANRCCGTNRRWLYEINNGQETGQEAQANAHLIAASPAMYEALKGFQITIKRFNEMLQLQAQAKFDVTRQIKGYTDTAIVNEMDGLLDTYGSLMDKALSKAEGK